MMYVKEKTKCTIRRTKFKSSKGEKKWLLNCWAVFVYIFVLYSTKIRQLYDSFYLSD